MNEQEQTKDVLAARACPKCGGRIGLATGYVFDLDFDQEPFEAGIIEDPGGELVPVGEIEITAHVCATCGWLQDVSVKGPPQEAARPAARKEA